MIEVKTRAILEIKTRLATELDNGSTGSVKVERDHRIGEPAWVLDDQYTGSEKNWSAGLKIKRGWPQLPGKMLYR